MAGPTELTDTGLHTVSNGDSAGTPKDPAFLVVIPSGDWSLAQISARNLLLEPGAHLTLTGTIGQDGTGLPVVSHLYDLAISPGAVLDDVGSALEANFTGISPGGTLEIQSTAQDAASDLPIKLGTLVNGGSLSLYGASFYDHNIELPGSNVVNPDYLLPVPG